jgi:16S rRNA (adenine1518-N6/adenine1519-N6)-dimethyltransferase
MPVSQSQNLYDKNRLYSPAYIRDILKLHAIELKKSLGQNFLFDRNSVEKIVRTAGITRDDVVLEIGPGIGHLTAMLLERAGHVIAIEIDRRFIDILKGILGDSDRLTLVQADVLKVDLAERLSDCGIMPTKIVANVPYYITTPILTHLVDSGIPFSSATFTLQKELAERYVAQPGTKAYGSISVVLSYWGITKLCGAIPARCFFPKPNVDSALLHIQMHTSPPVGVPDTLLFYRLIRLAFSKRRKMLHNALYPLEQEGYPVREALNNAGIPETNRAENLTLQDYARLTEALILAAAERMN